MQNFILFTPFPPKALIEYQKSDDTDSITYTVIDSIPTTFFSTKTYVTLILQILYRFSIHTVSLSVHSISPDQDIYI